MSLNDAATIAGLTLLLAIVVYVGAVEWAKARERRYCEIEAAALDHPSGWQPDTWPPIDWSDPDAAAREYGQIMWALLIQPVGDDRPPYTHTFTPQVEEPGVWRIPAPVVTITRRPYDWRDER